MTGYQKAIKPVYDKQGNLILCPELYIKEPSKYKVLDMSQKVKLHEATQKAIVIHNKLTELNKSIPQLEAIVKETKTLVEELKMLPNIA
jgi:hypothetical protein